MVLVATPQEAFHMESKFHNSVGFSVTPLRIQRIEPQSAEVLGNCNIADGLLAGPIRQFGLDFQGIRNQQKCAT